MNKSKGSKIPSSAVGKWPKEEAVTGIARDHAVPILGAVVFRVQMLELGKMTGPDILVRCKIFAKGNSDWLGIILGARALDCVERGGLGFYPTAGAHVFDRLGLASARAENFGFQDQYRDGAYNMTVQVVGDMLHAPGAPARSCLDVSLQEGTTAPKNAPPVL